LVDELHITQLLELLAAQSINSAPRNDFGIKILFF